MLDISWTTVILLSTVTSIGLYLILKKKRLEGQILPPCLPSLPLIGSIPFLPTDFLEIAKYFLNTSAKLGPVLAYYSGKRWVAIYFQYYFDVIITPYPICRMQRKRRKWALFSLLSSKQRSIRRLSSACSLLTQLHFVVMFQLHGGFERAGGHRGGSGGAGSRLRRSEYHVFR